VRLYSSTSNRKRNQIFIRQLVVVLPKRCWVAAQLTSTQIWSFLDVDVVFQEKCQISGYH
jgi:hypothetical protein